MEDVDHITPEGVSALMKELWYSHQRGEKFTGCKVFMVDLPLLTDEERKTLEEDQPK